MRPPSLTFPTGDGYAFVACEALNAKALRAHLTDQRGFAPERIRAAATGPGKPDTDGGRA